MSNKGLIIRIMLIVALFLGTATISMGQGLVTLSPSNASNPVGTTHTVIATVTINGTALDDQQVIFAIFSGPNSPYNNTSITNNSGQATYTYTSNGMTGTDKILAIVYVKDVGSFYSNIVTKTWIDSIPITEGFMKGKGSIFSGGSKKNGTEAKHEFELQCDSTKSPNNLIVKWDANKFVLGELNSIQCYDDLFIETNPKKAGFDVIEGSGTGTYNGIGGATIIWKFTDAGKSGKDDIGSIIIKDADGNAVLDIFGNLDKGKYEAHK